MKPSGRIHLSLDNKLASDLRKKAVQLGVSISAVAAGYIERGLYEESLARSSDRLDELASRLEQLLDRVENGNGHPSSQAVTPEEQRAFFLEVLLYFREMFKKNVGVRGDIAAQVKKHYGNSRVQGL